MSTRTEQVTIDLNAVEPYDADHGALTASQLVEFIKCPWLYYKRLSGLIEHADENDLISSAAHCRILEGRDMYERDHIASLTPRQINTVENMAAGVAMNDEAIDRLLFGRAMGMVKARFADVDFAIRPDWIHPHIGIIELEIVENLDWFEAGVRRSRLLNKLACQRAVLVARTGGDANCHVFAVESSEPYRCGVWEPSEESRSTAHIENSSALRRLVECCKRDEWPTGYEDVRTL